ncbi:protease [Paenibacillus hamazuiensis]|uniref:protease n=1 Tax=Paenibacillus hamazuiensis TaxID=2936508 RepID=UPI00200E2991|nr:protease [Paenibacillus hamazuiensis]
MLDLYWGCLMVGVLIAVVTVIFGDILSNLLGGALDFLSGEHLQKLQPMVLFGAVAVFGGAGILLEKYTGLHTGAVLVISILCAVVVSALTYMLYVRPMENSENSIGFSMKELVGGIAEVTVPIPAHGYGEVVVRVGGGLSNQIAASFDGVEIEAGAKVVTVEVKDHTLYVSRLDIKEP